MRYNIVKSQLHSFVIRLISTVFRCRPRCQQVIIRARDSFQPGHIPDIRIDAAGSLIPGAGRRLLCGHPRRAARARARDDGMPTFGDTGRVCVQAPLRALQY